MLKQRSKQSRLRKSFFEKILATFFGCTLLVSSAFSQANANAEPRFRLEFGVGAGDFAGSPDFPVSFSTGGVASFAGFVFANRNPTLPQPFDDEESSSRISFSYRVWNGLSVELGYSDIGEYQTLSGILSCTGSTTCDIVSPQLSVDQWSLGVRFDQRLTGRLSAVWRVGMIRPSYDVSTRRRALESGTFYIAPPFTLILDTIDSPDNETGSLLGTGIRWRFSDRIDLGLNYYRQDMRFGTAEILDLSVGVQFPRSR